MKKYILAIIPFLIISCCSTLSKDKKNEWIYDKSMRVIREIKISKEIRKNYDYKYVILCAEISFNSTMFSNVMYSNINQAININSEYNAVFPILNNILNTKSSIDFQDLTNTQMKLCYTIISKSIIDLIVNGQVKIFDYTAYGPIDTLFMIKCKDYSNNNEVNTYTEYVLPSGPVCFRENGWRK